MLTLLGCLLRMGRMRLRLVLIAICIALSPLCACFLTGGGTSKKVTDAVTNLNDHARWGRMSEAVGYVDPDYRDVFLDHHRLWGSDIQLADSEVLNITVANDSEQASAYVTYSWYAMADMTLHETTLRQKWTARDSTFVLSSEAAVRGDPSLLSAPDPNRQPGAERVPLP
jgi:hypothetical protein